MLLEVNRSVSFQMNTLEMSSVLSVITFSGADSIGIINSLVCHLSFRQIPLLG